MSAGDERDALAARIVQAINFSTRTPAVLTDIAGGLAADAVIAAGWRPPVAGDDLDTAQADLREIMLALGMSLHARPGSPHEVVQREVLPRIAVLTAAGDGAVCREIGNGCGCTAVCLAMPGWCRGPAPTTVDSAEPQAGLDVASELPTPSELQLGPNLDPSRPSPQDSAPGLEVVAWLVRDLGYEGWSVTRSWEEADRADYDTPLVTLASAEAAVAATRASIIAWMRSRGYYGSAHEIEEGRDRG